MSVGFLHNLIQRLRGARGQVDGLDDTELLRRFAQQRDEAAFEVLVWRHGAMVLGVCQRLLGRTPDADDAFQAVFLVLVRKAGTIRTPGALPGWLFRVAHRLALNLRSQRARRSARVLTTGDEPSAEDATPTGDLRAALDTEVNKLPEKLRQVVVLCYIEGLSTEEAARTLGCPRGTVLSRLAAARERLRGRLTRRGLAPAGVMGMLTALPSPLPPPATLVADALRGAAAFAAGDVGTVSPAALTLAQGALKAMFLVKVKAVAAAVLIGLTLAGAGYLATAAGDTGPGANNGPGGDAPRPVQVAQNAGDGGPKKDEPKKVEPKKDEKKEEPKTPDPGPEPPLAKVPIRGGQAGPESFDQALEWLKGNQLEQLVAIGSLAKSEVHSGRQPAIAKALEKCLEGPDRLVAQESTKALCVWATKDQVPALLKALEDPSVFVRRGAIEALGPLQDKRAVAPVAKFLPSFFERDQAGRALIRMGPIVENEMRKQLDNADKNAREEAARILRQIGKTGKDDEFIAALGGLKDKDLFSRKKALEWFQNAASDHPRQAEAATAMAKLLTAGGAFDKIDAAKALTRWATVKEVPALVQTLRERSQPHGVKPAVMKALGRLKDSRAAPALAEMLADPFDSGDAVKSLIAIGPLAEDEVQRQLTNDRYKARVNACQVLSEIGTAKCVPALEATLDRATRNTFAGSRDIADAARAALAAIKGRQ